MRPLRRGRCDPACCRADPSRAGCAARCRPTGCPRTEAAVLGHLMRSGPMTAGPAGQGRVHPPAVDDPGGRGPGTPGTTCAVTRTRPTAVNSSCRHHPRTASMKIPDLARTPHALAAGATRADWTGPTTTRSWAPHMPSAAWRSCRERDPAPPHRPEAPPPCLRRRCPSRCLRRRCPSQCAGRAARRTRRRQLTRLQPSGTSGRRGRAARERPCRRRRISRGRDANHPGCRARRRPELHLRRVAGAQLPALLRRQVVSNTGTWMQRIAQDWLVLSLTGSSPPSASPPRCSSCRCCSSACTAESSPTGCPSARSCCHPGRDGPPGLALGRPHPRRRRRRSGTSTSPPSRSASSPSSTTRPGRPSSSEMVGPDACATRSPELRATSSPRAWSAPPSPAC